MRVGFIRPVEAYLLGKKEHKHHLNLHWPTMVGIQGTVSSLKINSMECQSWGKNQNRASRQMLVYLNQQRNAGANTKLEMSCDGIK